MNTLLTKIGVAGTTSVVLTETLNLDTLWNALLTLAVSILSVLSVEGIAWLKKHITSKTNKIDNGETKEKDDKE